MVAICNKKMMYIRGDVTEVLNVMTRFIVSTFNIGIICGKGILIYKRDG